MVGRFPKSTRGFIPWRSAGEGAVNRGAAAQRADRDEHRCLPCGRAHWDRELPPRGHNAHDRCPGYAGIGPGGQR
jgi:hypothetical protein